jgi:hypothetical protein
LSTGCDAAAGASLRPKGSLAIAGLSNILGMRTTRGLDAIAAAWADVWADVPADASADAGGTAVRAASSGLGALESAPGAAPSSTSREAAALEAAADPNDALSETRSAMTPHIQSAPAIPPSSRQVIAMRNSRRKRGGGQRNPNSG